MSREPDQQFKSFKRSVGLGTSQEAGPSVEDLRKQSKLKNFDIR